MQKSKTAKKERKNSGGKRLGLGVAGLAFSAVLIVGIAVYSNHSSALRDETSMEGGVYVRRETKPTLSPALFVGRVHTAYQVAHDMPDVLDHLYCYCECDKHSGHRSLLSCYTDTHAANCNVCVNEALDAAKMMNDGYEIQEVRRQIDRKYGRS